MDVFILGVKLLFPSTFLLWIILTSSFTIPVVLSKTDSRQGWKKDGGDPCGDDSWQGIKCSGSDVTEIDLSGLGLSGSLGFQLDKLEKVTYFAVM